MQHLQPASKPKECPGPGAPQLHAQLTVGITETGKGQKGKRQMSILSKAAELAAHLAAIKGEAPAPAAAGLSRKHGHTLAPAPPAVLVSQHRNDESLLIAAGFHRVIE